MTESDAAGIDVIVPVHNAIDDADRLMASLARAASTSHFTLHVVDDASTTYQVIALPMAGGALEAVIFHRNPVNLGFAASINLVLRQTRRDVVILNSDTLVHDGWLDRLRTAAATNARTATVTPLSNAATILSYPTVCADTKHDIEVGWAEIDRMCCDIGHPPVEIPTGVGFCMLITRACLETIGLLDETTFGAGYGEECDFCRRAASNGWVNLAAPNVFVWHRGQASFKERRIELAARAQDALDRRFPGYPNLIAAHLKRDPLASLRQMLDLARLRRQGPYRLEIGANHPRDPLEASCPLTLKRTGPRFRPVWRIEATGFTSLPSLPSLTRFSSRKLISDFLTKIEPTAILVHDNGPDPKGDGRFPKGLANRLCRAAVELGIPIEVVKTSQAGRSRSSVMVDRAVPSTIFGGDYDRPRRLRRRCRTMECAARDAREAPSGMSRANAKRLKP